MHPGVLILLLSLLASTSWGAVRPLVDRIDAIVGYDLVFPISADDEDRLLRDFPVRLDDGREPEVAVWWIGASSGRDGGWLGPLPVWSAIEPKELRRITPRPSGVWHAIVRVPVDAFSQGLWIDGERYELNWLSDPERAQLEAGDAQLWASPVPNEALESSAVIDALDVLASDPFLRWRSRLVRDGLAPLSDRTGQGERALGSIVAELDQSPGARALDTVARYHEARWQLILGRLALIDDEAAERMRRRLAGVAMVGDSWKPFWTPDSPALRELEADLLSPFVDDETRVLRALGWLDTQPKAVAWVIDDGGSAYTGADRLGATVALVSTPARTGAVLLEAPGISGGPTLTTVQPSAMVTVATGVRPSAMRGSGTSIRVSEVPLRVGGRVVTTEAVSTIPSVRPPGLRVGPLLNTWTLPALLEGSPDLGALPQLNEATTGLLRKRGTPGRSDDQTGWSLFLQCDGDTSADSIEIWTGAYGASSGAWRIDREGSVERLAGYADLVSISVVETDSGWAVDALLPTQSVDSDGVLRFGVIRGTGADRVSWPRRVLPDQREPGRLAVDATGWDGIR